MGFLTTGRTAQPKVVLDLIKTTFHGVANQHEVDARVPQFKKALADRQIIMQPTRDPRDARVVWHRELGVVVDGWTFRFPEAAQQPPG